MRQTSIYKINADDFGYNSSVNKAIKDCFNDKIINSATLLSNFDGFEEAIEIIHNNQLSENIGLHLCLTEGAPLTEEMKKVSFLFNGNIPLKVRLKYLMIPSKSIKLLIYNEYKAQIEKAIKHKIQINHLDTHHQLHDMWGITRIIESLLEEYKIPQMRILNNTEPSASPKKIYRNHVNQYLRRKNIAFSDYMGNQISCISYIKNDKLSGASFEIMVHPLYNDENQLVDRIGKSFYSFDDLFSLINH